MAEKPTRAEPSAPRRVHLSRQYTYNGVLYGPGQDVEIAPFDETDADPDKATLNRQKNDQALRDLQKREKEYADHLARGGNPDAPITPTAAGQPEPQVPYPNTVVNAQGHTVNANPQTAQKTPTTAVPGTQSPSPQQQVPPK